MGYQKCPLCNGTGIDPVPGFTSTNACPICPVCQGRRIISEVTGLPPVNVQIFGTPQYQPPKNTTDISYRGSFYQHLPTCL